MKAWTKSRPPWAGDPGNHAARARLCAVALGATLSGCTGQISGDQLSSSAPTVIPVVSIGAQATAMHRLNRLEYTNTVRDLLGEPLPLGNTMPEDQINALGFDNDGASLLVSPLLVARWSDVAEQLVGNLFARLSPLSQAFDSIVPSPCTNAQPGIDVCGTVNGGFYMGDKTSGFWGMISASKGLTIDTLGVPADGVYALTMKAFATPVVSKGGAAKTPSGSPYPVKLSVTIDGNATNFDVTAATFAKPLAITVNVPLTKGSHAFAATSLRDTQDPDNQDGNWYAKALYVGNITLSGPTSGAAPTPNVLDCGGADPTSDDCVTTILTQFATRAWRRPATADEVAALQDLVHAVQNNPDEPGDAGQKTSQGLKTAFEATLISPNFLYRPEIDPDPNAGSPRPLNGYELASRLSYFLWSSMPDDELFAHAADDSLDQDEVSRQVDRMLADPKAFSFVQSFAGQWLQLRRLPGVTPDTTLFPKFSSDVRSAMQAETTSFFAEFLKPGHSFPDMLDANFTFVNPTLATFYGLTPGSGADIAKVSLGDSKRVGLLSQGSFLTLTSHANRTSPVLRGKFVLNQLLCESPPPPPANVPPFNEDASAGTVRQRLEAHVSSGACSGCHALMDPIGFSLENFDAVGEYRDSDNGAAIDTSGLVLDKTPISNVTTLAAAIKQNPAFVPCVIRNFLSYGLGHEVDDMSQIDTLTQASQSTGYELASLIHIIVSNDAFMTRKAVAE